MPWRLILFTLFVVLIVVFVGVNLDNKCAVSLIFVTYQDVPVFISILIAFALGILLMIPFTFGKSAPREKPEPRRPAAPKARPRKEPAPVQDEDVPAEPAAKPLNND